ncbi:MAG: hypothetical protein JWN26_818 [Candidatus Saccharibacteria bacterium]|nr:hypothetical protein [Candidatus Saccharibacteria bacterium]
MTYIPPNANGSAVSANSAPVVIASDQVAVPTKIVNGTNVVGVSPFGALAASIDPAFLFLDTFDGTTIDITNRWTSGGTVTPTQNGSVLVNPSTTASATSALSSQPTFSANANTSLGIFIQLEATTIALGNYRFWGYGTAPSGVGTAAAPIQDGIGFEVDTSGVMRASVYATGTRIFTQTVAAVTDGGSHLYVITINTGTILFYRDTFAAPLAVSQLVPTIQTLPFHVASLNSASVTGTPTLTGTQAGIADFAHQSQSIGDGTYYWRKATVKAASAVAVATDTSLVVALSPINNTVTVGFNSPSVFNLSSAASTNANLVKNGFTKIYSINASNAGAAAAFLKIFNLAVAPTVGTSVPYLTVPIPASGIVGVNFGALGMTFGTGLSLSITNLIADTDTTSVTNAQVKVLVSYV